MRKKTPNVQRSTPNAEFRRRATPLVGWVRDRVRVNELPNTNYGAHRQARRYNLEARLLDFAVNIVQLTESFPTTRSGNHLAGQLLRCGTSPLSNHGEVEAAESRKDSSQAANLPEGTTRNQALVAFGQPVEKIWTRCGSSRLPWRSR